LPKITEEELGLTKLLQKQNGAILGAQLVSDCQHVIKLMACSSAGSYGDGLSWHVFETLWQWWR